MARLAIIVEGDGEESAAPALVRRILELRNRYDLYHNIQPLNTKGRGNLVVENGLEKFLRTARKLPDCTGIIVLLDAEKENRACPPDLALSLSQRARQVGLQIPVVIVCAVCEYESWFLASIDKIAGKYDIPEGTTFPGNPEDKCGAKEWLTSQMQGSNIYKETIHQAKMTHDLDLQYLSENIRSFQRMIHAVDELLAAIDSGDVIVTPPP